MAKPHSHRRGILDGALHPPEGLRQLHHHRIRRGRALAARGAGGRRLDGRLPAAHVAAQAFPDDRRGARRLRLRDADRHRRQHAAAPPGHVRPLQGAAQPARRAPRLRRRRRRAGDGRRLHDLPGHRRQGAVRRHAGRGGAAGDDLPPRRPGRGAAGRRARGRDAGHPIVAGLGGRLAGAARLQPGRRQARRRCWSPRRRRSAARRRHASARAASVAFTSDCGPHWAPPPFVDWTGYARSGSRSPAGRRVGRSDPYRDAGVPLELLAEGTRSCSHSSSRPETSARIPADSLRFVASKPSGRGGRGRRRRAPLPAGGSPF